MGASGAQDQRQVKGDRRGRGGAAARGGGDDDDDASTSSAASRRPARGAQGAGGGWDPERAERVHARARLHALLRPVWLLRARMHLVVDALLYHLQVDVVSSAHAQFEASAAQAGDYGALQAAHDTFLRSLLDGAFLAQPSVSACVARLLNHCERFVALVSAANAANLQELVSARGGAPGSAAGGRGGSVGVAGASMLEELAASFSADARFLETAGSERAALRGADAGSLLMRLNFNGFFIAT